jgi:hypothetical protein
MRLIERIERSFVSGVVNRAKQVIRAPKPTSEKVSNLERLAARHEERATAFRRLGSKPGARPERKEKLGRLIGMCDSACGYLRTTADYLLHRERHPDSLRQMPRVFAVPRWMKMAEKPVDLEP